MKTNLGTRWVIFLGLPFAVGCATSRVASPTAKVPKSMAIETLNRTQYEVLGRTSGQGKAHFVGLWPLPIWWVQTDDNVMDGQNVGRGFVFWGTRPAVHARHIARQRAIESFVKADDLLEPTERVHRRFNPWDARTQVTVSGKAISIKTDKECAATGGNCWESLKWGAKE